MEMTSALLARGRREATVEGGPLLHAADRGLQGLLVQADYGGGTNKRIQGYIIE